MPDTPVSPPSALSEIRAFDYQPVPQGNHAFEQAVRAARDVPRLVAAIEAADAALKRHMQWFDSMGERLCGGCLMPSPCPDTDVIAAALAGKEAGDGS